jgi:hypothetical protein
VRFVIDDAPWAPDDVLPASLAEGLEGLLERLRIAKERSEPVYAYADLFQHRLVGDHTLNALLYDDAANPYRLPKDLRRQLQLRIDKTPSFDEGQLTAVDADIAGERCTSPAAVLAFQRVLVNKATACLTPACSRRSGSLSVRVDADVALVHYVSDEAQHVAFFRDAVEVENADEGGFSTQAPHAFPDLVITDNLWRGLRDLSQPYRARRAELARLLGALSDHGARIFAMPQRDWESQFASRGVHISGESSNDMKPPCRKHREREYGGETLVFEWHIKIEAHVDRIHVHPGTQRSNYRVIVGIITRHLPMSSRGEC